MIKSKLAMLIEDINQALESDDYVTLTSSELKMLNIKVKGIEYDNFTENDSPKGEFIMGTRSSIQNSQSCII